MILTMNKESESWIVCWAKRNKRLEQILTVLGWDVWYCLDFQVYWPDHVSQEESNGDTIQC